MKTLVIVSLILSLAVPAFAQVQFYDRNGQYLGSAQSSPSTDVNRWQGFPPPIPNPGPVPPASSGSSYPNSQFQTNNNNWGYPQPQPYPQRGSSY
ncbi:MAG: hypothetical protein WC600_03315 [Desulfobaccales bacterium]